MNHLRRQYCRWPFKLLFAIAYALVPLAHTASANGHLWTFLCFAAGWAPMAIVIGWVLGWAPEKLDQDKLRLEVPADVPFCERHQRWPCKACGTFHYAGCQCTFCR